MPDFEKLNGIYRLLDRETRGFPLACKDRCPDCCTVNVTATSLEVAFIFNRLGEGEIQRMIQRLRAGFPGKRYIPRITVNGFARACMEGVDLPEEENNPGWGACPLLIEDRCSIYGVRPLGCRVMMSEALCRENGFAQMPPFALTLSNLLGQVLEQADGQGFTGNFNDILAAYARAWESGAGRGNGPLYLTLDNIAESDRKERLLGNQPVSALMIPPEHRDRSAPLIPEIRALGDTGK